MEDEQLATINKVNHSYTWKIDYNLLKLQKVGQYLQRDFSVDYFGYKWHLSLYPRGVDDSDGNCTSLFIDLMGSKKYPVNAEVSFYILNSKGFKCNKYSFNFTFHQHTEGDGTYTFIPFSDLISNNLLVNNNLIIFCEISAQTSVAVPKEKDEARMHQLNLDKLSQDFQKITKNSRLSDVTLVVRGHRFSVHKIILSARSPVFAAWFNSDMKEATQKEINIDDVELDVFKEMLRFVYTGKVKNLDKLAYELFSLSDKYGLEDLKSLCGSFLYKNLTTNNAIDIFLLLDRHSAIEFKNRVLDFIMNHKKFIINTEKFKVLQKTYPSFSKEMLRTAANR